MKLSVFSEYPGTADGIYKLKAKGCIAATLHWADADGALDGWSAFACLPVDAYGNGSFRYQGGRNIPPGTSHILARAVTADFGQVQEQLFLFRHLWGKRVSSFVIHRIREQDIGFAL